MKLVLSCDDCVFSFNGEYYAKNNERYEFYCRYLRVFESVRLVVRNKVVDHLSISCILLPKTIEVVGIPDYSGPKEYAKQYFRIGQILQHAVDDCSAAILRLPSTIGQRLGHLILRKRIPYAIEVVCDAHDYYACETNLIHKFLWKIIDLQQRHLCFFANGVSCVTQRYLQRRYYSKIKGHFTSAYSSISLYDSFISKPRTFPQGEFNLVHVANQVDYDGRKGHKEVLEAVSLLNQKGIFPTVTFVGSDYHDGISKLSSYVNKLNLKSKISFTGYLNREQLEVFLENSDLFVFPTRAEGLPRVVIEAMAKGLPCVTSNVSGLPEIVQHELLVEYDDIQGLADRIERLMTNGGYYEFISAQNIETSKSFRSEVLEAKRDEFYKALRTLCVI